MPQRFIYNIFDNRSSGRRRFCCPECSRHKSSELILPDRRTHPEIHPHPDAALSVSNRKPHRWKSFHHKRLPS